MITEHQITYIPTERGLKFTVKDTETIIAFTNKERFVDYNIEFEESLTPECKNLIEYISKEFDDIYFPDENDETICFRVFNNLVELKETDKVRHVGTNVESNIINVIEYASGVIEYFLVNHTYVIRELLIKVLVVTLPTPEKEKLYYIQKNGDYLGNAIMWWKENNKGYTADIKKAKKFTEETFKLITNCSDKFTVWECDYIDNNKESLMLVVDHQYLDLNKSIKNV